MKKIINTLKKDYLLIIIVLAGFIVGAVFFQKLPNRVPIHWDSNGNVNGYGSKFTAAFLMPIVNLFTYLLFKVIPHIDPERKNYDKFMGSYKLVEYITMIVLLVMEVFTLMYAVGFKVNISLICGLIVSAVLICIGNMMGRFRFNYFVGIRDPWTLANEDVWKNTHRVSGPIWVLGGIVNIVFSFIGGKLAVYGFLVVIIIISVFPVVYSYMNFRKFQKTQN